jgi:hypothetical protein
MTEAGFKISDAAEGDEPKRRPRGRPKQPKPHEILAGIMNGAKLWYCAQHRAGFVSVPCGDWFEHHPVKSEGFSNWLLRRFHAATEKPLGGGALKDFMATVNAEALEMGDRGAYARAWRRVAWHDGAIFLDLGGFDPLGERRAVEITAGGWRMVESGKVPVAFLRGEDALPLPEPIAGAGQYGDLGRFVSCSEIDLNRAWAWIMTALRPFMRDGSYAILLVTGLQNSGKSLMMRFLGSLLDPVTLTGAAPPRDEDGLYAIAAGRHVIAFDNLSGLSGDLSDGLARIATGGAMMKRSLFSNFDLAAMRALKPIALNGIPSNLVERLDTQSRCLKLELIRPAERIDEQVLNAEFEAARPGLLGLICDGLASALRNLDRVAIDGRTAPRNIDGARWVEAAAEGLGIAPGAMLSAWRDNDLAAARDAIGLDELAAAVVAFMAAREEVRGESLSAADRAIDRLEEDSENRWGERSSKFSPKFLFDALTFIAGYAPEKSKPRSWPQDIGAMSKRLQRLSDALKNAERIQFESGRDNGGRWISLRRIAPAD